MTGGSNSLDVERLKADIHQEEQIKQSLEQSCHELTNTAVELEKRLKLIDEESNEWKTRFENQEEINRHLHRQIALLEKRIENAREELKTAKTRATKIDTNEISKESLSEIEGEKRSLLSQLRDYEWRLEQENKAYHKANEERKTLTNEITDIRNTISVMKEKNQLPDHPSKNDRVVQLTSRTDYPTTERDAHNNIPMDKRIIDPKKGPINKNATVRALPKITNKQ